MPDPGVPAPDPEAHAQQTSKPEVPVCRFFAKGCRNGDKCRFRHPEPAAVPPKPLSGAPPELAATNKSQGARAAQSKKKRRGTKSRKWWRSLDEVDPITLEPVSELSYAPFKLNADEQISYYFDGRVLANYLISSSNFLHPVSRRELSREECQALDAYLIESIRMKKASVTKVFDHSREAAAKASPDIAALQEEARLFVESLFQFGAAAAHEQPADAGGMTMIDDDETLELESNLQANTQPLEHQSLWPELRGGPVVNSSQPTMQTQVRTRRTSRLGSSARCWTVTDTEEWDPQPVNPGTGDDAIESCGLALCDQANAFVYLSVRGDKPEMLSARWRSVPKDTFTTQIDTSYQEQVQALASIALIPGTMLVEYKRVMGEVQEGTRFRVRVLCNTGAPDYGSVPRLRLFQREVKPTNPVSSTSTVSSTTAATDESSTCVQLQPNALEFVPGRAEHAAPEEQEHAAPEEEPSQEVKTGNWEQTLVDDYGNPKQGEWVTA